MQIIQNGIKLHSELDNFFDEVQINSGTVHHLQQEKAKVDYLDWSFVPQYEDNAYVVKRDWRKLTDQEIKALTASKNRNYYNTIYVGDISDELKHIFDDLKFKECLRPKDVKECMKRDHDLTLKLSNTMQEYLSEFANDQPFHFHFIGANLPNIDMVAADTYSLPDGYQEEDKKCMGIHNDGAELRSVHQTYKSGNRFTINLGNETRYFLYVNLSLTQAFNMLKEKLGVSLEHVNLYNISKLFFKYFPDYPVIRIPQKPYQYYISATDHCFHDGSTYGMTTLDVLMIYFGKFQY
ncbi:hypothetical protein C8N46_105243 [Kordia periserrulae]|uniref:Uncharacterized protein n=1 Tax=Kordia periserrulae TaxID=701523 RepID=A0A2T6BYQ0_9FLAO|nr:hypothetical protein [Kordia periserrulae]PTX61087.1 hypothetical protein C8N46_105243 [Kordia periserrulae]